MDSPASVLAFFLLFPFLNLPCALSKRETGLCDHLFECGNITAGFPFWGVNRPFHCGHPLLKLQCNSESNTTFLVFSGVLYNVLRIDNLTNTLKLVREEFSSGSLCDFSGQFLNDTLPPQLFEHSPPYKNLTIFHHCDPRYHYLEKFTCPWSGLGSVYQKPEYSTHCREIVNVTVPASFLPDMESWSLSLLESVLKEGFEVKLKLEFDQEECQKCSSSGGFCGFDSSNGFRCYTLRSYEVEERHRTCVTPFPCGNQPELSYPFWIKGREDCGHPDFEVDCDGGFAEFNISSVNLRILQVDFLVSRTITLARTDYLGTLCPNNLVNVSLFNEIFLGYLPGTEVLTLYHDCRDLSSFSPAGYIGELPCEYDDGGKGYFVTTNISLPLLDGVRAMLNEFTRSCQSVDIPASGPALVALQESPNPQNLQKVFGEGFGLTLNYATCNACRESGGACGYNRTAEAFVCYCMNDSHDRTCDSGKKGLPGGAKIGIGLACGLVGGLLIAGGVFCFIRQRRKKLWAQYTSKDLPTTPYSSTGTTTTATSTTVSRSMHSFQSSDSNLGNGSVYFGVKVFGYEELEEATENFSKELGDGGFGTVYYGVLRDGRAVAVKRLYERSLRRVEQFKNEIDILKSLKHPNLVILYGCTSRHSRELLLVYEYISNGTLADHLHGDRAKTHHLSWPVRLEIAIETANALSYLHASGIIHRDVKTTNILLDNNFQVKVADFGLSRLFPTDATHVSTAPQGTPGYVDPEYYQCYRLNEKSDVYSFGVVLAELISSKEAVDIARHRHDINLANMAVTRIQNSAMEELVDPDLGFDRDFAVRRMVTAVAELAFRCLQQEREVRPSMDEVVEALRGIKKEEMSEPAEMVDIRGGDDVVLLRNGGAPPLLSPETDKWTNSSNSNTTGSSF